MYLICISFFYFICFRFCLSVLLYLWIYEFNFTSADYEKNIFPAGIYLLKVNNKTGVQKFPQKWLLVFL